MGIISWIFLGLIAGALPKFLVPGKDPGGSIVTILIGIVGAILGGFLGSFIGLGRVESFDIGGLIIATLGAIVLFGSLSALSKGNRKLATRASRVSQFNPDSVNLEIPPPPMGLFSNLLSKVFGQQTAAATTPPPAATGGTIAAGAPAPASSGSAPSAAVLDVAAILDDLAAKNPEKLDWRKSIVDLMKLVDMDSSLASRKELAKDLNYSGDTSDSAKMNIWLHKEVIRKISENGGKVPQDLLS